MIFQYIFKVARGPSFVPTPLAQRMDDAMSRFHWRRLSNHSRGHPRRGRRLAVVLAVLAVLVVLVVLVVPVALVARC